MQLLHINHLREDAIETSNTTALKTVVIKNNNQTYYFYLSIAKYIYIIFITQLSAQQNTIASFRRKLKNTLTENAKCFA